MSLLCYISRFPKAQTIIFFHSDTNKVNCTKFGHEMRKVLLGILYIVSMVYSQLLITYVMHHECGTVLFCIKKGMTYNSSFYPNWVGLLQGLVVAGIIDFLSAPPSLINFT